MILRLLILCLALILPACVSSTQPKLFEVPTGREKANIPFWWIPHEAAQATLVLFTGGAGNLGPNNNDALNGPPSWERSGFLVRNWERFHKEGFNIAIVGRAQDRVQAQDGSTASPVVYRASAEHSREIREVLQNIKQLASEKDIWLVGHSMGTVAVENATIANPDIVVGEVLLSSITHLGGVKSPRGTIPASGLKFEEIRVPTLMLSHSQDMCPGSQPEHAKDNFSALSNAPRKELVFLSGGRPSVDNPCDSRHYHGFFGIEGEVVKRTASWIRASSGE